MPNHEISPVNFRCAVEGCNANAIQELWEDFEGQTLFLSVCSDPEHQAITRSFLKEKADIGRACIEFEARNCIHNDSGFDLEKELTFQAALSEHLHKLIEQGDI